MEPMLPEQTIDPDAEKRLGLLGNGCVLLARDALADPNFSATVVLICVFDKEDGAYGLVLNRPSHMPLSEIFDGITDMGGRREVHREVYIGGPVQQAELQVIQITDFAQPLSHQVAPRVFLGGKWENIDSMLVLDPDSTRLFLGYSGWAPGQLETEIVAGAWDVYRIDVEKLLINKQEMLSADVKSISAYLDTLRITPQ
jgi:putative transcriptional regulator